MKCPLDGNQWRKDLGPSKFSAEGFLGDDERTLDEIISADLRSLEETGVTKQQVVDALHEVYSKAREALGAEVQIAPDVVAVYYESRGRIPSPFRGEGSFEKGEVMVRDVKSTRSMSITSLSIYLIEKHDFFQGRGARYRIDPKVAIEMLSIQKDTIIPAGGLT